MMPSSQERHDASSPDTEPDTTHPKAKKRRHTIVDKINILQEMEPPLSLTNKEIRAKYQIGNTTLHKWKVQYREGKYQEAVEKGMGDAKSVLARELEKSCDDDDDDQLNAPCAPWKGSIPFSVYVLGEEDMHGNNVLSIFGRPPQKVDICYYLNGGPDRAQDAAKRLYFCPRTYPPPKNNDEMTQAKDKQPCKGWVHLKNSLYKAARDAGSPIFSDGGDRGSDRIFRCFVGYRTNQSRAAKKKRENDKNKKPKCKFQFSVKWDEIGFFVKLQCRAGQPGHQHHARPSLIQLQSMKDPQIEEEELCDSKSAIPELETVRAARKALEPIMDSALTLTAITGVESVKKLQETFTTAFTEYHAWCNAQLKRKREREIESVQTGKKAYTPATEEGSAGTAKRVCNTHDKVPFGTPFEI
mmetsp:Transcript_6714/g.15284  ORF Transcript_6714/g.15284 Transcript_6714/m.15284 type:complete len:413 (+) Transcript_6714:126-1364(+)